MTQPFDPTGPARPDPAAPGASTRPLEPIDDLALAGLIRDVADGWHLPPRRLHEPAWSDRVDRRRVGGRSLGGRLGRLAGAGLIAVTATVVLALVAVTLDDGRRGQLGVGGGPTASPGTPGQSVRTTPGTSASPSPSPLPVLLERGTPPSVTTALVRVGDGHALVDLAAGTVGDPISTATGGSTLVRRADGTLACLCFDTDGYSQGAYTHATIRFRTYGPDGTAIGNAALGDFTGIPDPRPAAAKDQPSHIATQTSVSPDGRLGFVGWAGREPPLWHMGVVVVDMTSGEVVARLSLPDVSTGADDAPVQAIAPRIALSPAGDRLLVTSSAYRFEGVAQDYRETTTHHVAPIDGTSIGPLAGYAPSAACTTGENRAGIASDGGAWLVCWTAGGSSQTVRRIAPDGTVLGDTLVNATGEGGTTTVAADGSALWTWAPTTRTLTRVDLRTGQDASSTAPAPPSASTGDWLAALGGWIAPSAGAKVFLDPGIVLSPDGSRVYALGIDREPSGSPFGGSSGIFVFDAQTLAPLDHWAPVADDISIAVSADGRWVYAAGAPGVDAAGRPAPFDASITVHDATDGSVRVIAGRLGSQSIAFDAPVLR